MKHLDPSKLMIGDVLCTTSFSPFAAAIRRRTWEDRGWAAWSRMDHGTHCAVVCDRGGGLLYASEMLAGGGPEMTELHAYDRDALSWGKHICAVMRHPGLDDSKRTLVNEYMIKMHSIKVRYGYEELLRFINPHVPDDPYTMICSMWILSVYKFMALPLPPCWLSGPVLLSPADWQRCTTFTTVKGAVS